MIMSAVSSKHRIGFMPVLLIISFMIGLFVLLPGIKAQAAGGHDITISGPGLIDPGPVVITREQLQGLAELPEELQAGYGQENLKQHDEYYSTINTWPTKSWYRGQGVKLSELLKAAGGVSDQARQIKFTSADGFTAAYSLQDMLGENRYRYPHFMDTGLPGYLAGDASGAETVDTIIAYLISYASTVEEIMEDSSLSNSDANLLMFGQQAVTQQTNARFVKYVKKIEVLTEPLPQWSQPTASVTTGEVPLGTKVKLRSQFNEEDKVHYTVDGSEPTIESPMYNWIASRWWSTRTNDLEVINHPIAINEDTVIKAFVSGPGKADSATAVFTYTIAGPLAIDGTGLANATVNQKYVGHVFTARGGIGPYTFAVTGGTLPRGMVLTGATLEGTPLESGTFTFTVTVTDSAHPAGSISCGFTLLINDEKITPPVLTADIKAKMNEAVKITFGDDELWRRAITGIKVNGVSIAGQYDLQPGIITIAPIVFKATGNYTVSIAAAGYLEAEVTQKISAAGDIPQPPEEIVLTIDGNGVATTREYTQAELEDMRQYQEVYSCINTWPSKRWYVGQGVKLEELLNAAGIKGNAQQIRFYSQDGYYMTLTVQELLRDQRYRFPNFKSGSGDADGHIPGSSSGATPVESILALVSAEGTDDPAYMNQRDALLLMLGQRTVTEQTGPQFAKYINRIEVLTQYPSRWGQPTAEPGEGTVAAGTQVVLHSPYDDEDKVYYTTDGSIPDMNSQMYNLVAKRWWGSRGEATVKTINKPIVLTKDTTIKAITIGPGRLNSEAAVFTYKVMGLAMNISDKILPAEGGKLNLGEEVFIEIPPGAMAGVNPVEVKIQRVPQPPAAPAGFKFLGEIYEFIIDGGASYDFAEPVTISLAIDPEDLAGENLSICYYDSELKEWVSIGGVLSGNIISVAVDHFTMFAVMAAEKPAVVKLIKPEDGGSVNLGREAEIEIPARALSGNKPVEIKIERVGEYPVLPEGYEVIAGVYEFKVDGQTEYKFNKPVTIKLGYNSQRLGPQGFPALYSHDGDQWINMGGKAADGSITVQVKQLTGPVTVMAGIKMPINLNDIKGHWAEAGIKELIMLGAIGGYPDGTFKPDNTITRAEFTSILVEAFDLRSHDTKGFGDTAGHWAEKSISIAVHNGIVQGYDENRFGPDEYITREQMALMTSKAVGLTPAIAATAFTDDGSIAAWARGALAAAVKNRMISGYPDNTVRPQGNATRAEAVTVIVNALHRLETGLNTD